ncbi:MAG: nickel pincer cofactor biosynthesis protein LarB [Moorea sp. SIO2B7]|nr:nickel pincer cofactor biosynthesis protein LarB [Moorena sp. SIO2B7]
MMNQEILQNLLESVATGKTTPNAALGKLKNFGFETVGEFAKIDYHRSLRTGFPEVIWGAGKTSEQIVQIIEVMRYKNREMEQDLPIMATLIEPEVFTQLQSKIHELKYYPMARICALLPENLEPRYPGLIAVMSAGTSDLPVAEEAAITAELSGFRVNRLWDVGVAGIHRLLNNLHFITEADVLIVVAGMEGALPSVVGGLADCPVIAVPTSVGYGASFKGISALLTMLNSCASGIGVMNIDNGFGAAILAGKILRTAHKLNNNTENKFIKLNEKPKKSGNI